MSDLGRFGDGLEGHVIDQFVEDTDPVVSNPVGLARLNMVCAQLVTEGEVRSFLTEATDTAADAANAWTLANGAFTADDVGGTFTVTGSEDNDGTWTIATVVDADQITTVESPTDETFAAGVQIVLTPLSTLDGAWTVEVSNDFTPASNGSSYGQVPEQGHWTDLTEQFSPLIADVDHTDAATMSQYVQAELACRSIRFTFTATTGVGHVLCMVYGKTQG